MHNPFKSCANTDHFEVEKEEESHYNHTRQQWAEKETKPEVEKKQIIVYHNSRFMLSSSSSHLVIFIAVVAIILLLL